MKKAGRIGTCELKGLDNFELANGSHARLSVLAAPLLQEYKLFISL